MRLIVLVFCFLPLLGFSQILGKEVVGAYAGNSLLNATFFTQSTAGQPSNIGGFSKSNDFYISQGFHRPVRGYFISEPTLEISLFPNPNDGNFTLRIKSDETINFDFLICDIAGRIVKSGKLTDLENSIQIQGLVTGTYLISIPTKNKFHTIKFDVF